METLISVIVPVYNVEQYLERCVRSLLSQTFPHFEILLIDDGSTDRSGEICEWIGKEDKRIHTFHKENGGLSDARNFGLQRAVGEYVTFVDSDDYVSADFLKVMYENALCYSADIVCGRLEKTESNQCNFDLESKEIITVSGKKACEYMLMPNLYQTLVVACAKLYRIDIVKKYQFPVGRKHEDEATTCKFFWESNRVVILPNRIYAYYQNPNSIMHTRGKEIDMDAIWAIKHRACFYDEKEERKLSKLAWGFAVKYLIDDSLRNSDRSAVKVKELYEKKYTLKTRLQIILYLDFRPLYRKIIARRNAHRS